MAVEMKYGDYIKGGVDIFKANLVPSLVATLCMCIPIVGMQVQINYLKAVKEAKNNGKPIEIGAMFDFSNVVNNIVALFILGLSMYCCVVPFFMLLMIPTILADHPGVGFMDAVKAALAFGKKNIVPMILFGLVLGIFISLGSIACGVGIFATLPIGLAAHWLAYEDHKATIHADAAEAGITLA
jgi:uncharacterized membrane protein